ncbi:MAG: hypothetical protein P1U81_02465 [Verrucomicrobiales bacterium]|nr:hypothetical protein [Verrucomicrobiales bacterium]
MEDSIQELADAIYREKVLRARKMSVAERIETGIELGIVAEKAMISGIRAQFPEASAEEQKEILTTRLRRLRKLHERDLFKIVN